MKMLRGVAVLLPALCAGGVAAHAQQTGNAPPISFGGRGWGGVETATSATATEPETVHFSIKAGAATDYIYRGTSLSDRKPAVGGVFEATYKQFYTWASAASVRLPTVVDRSSAPATSSRSGPRRDTAQTSRSS